MATRGRVTVIAVLCFLALSAPRATAVSILEASLGFGGYSARGKWSPLWIRCTGAPRSSSIEVVRLGRYGRKIGVETFPASVSVLECPVRLSDDLAALRVRLLSEHRVLAEMEVLGTARLYPGQIVLACGLGASSRLAISASLMPEEPVIVVPMRPSELPSNGLDYDGVSAVVLYGSGNGYLSETQRNALRAWLAGGGSLAGTGTELESLGLGFPVPGEGGSSAAFGFGRYRLLEYGERLGSVPWREVLALRPYGETFRLGASEALSEAGVEPVEPVPSRRTRRMVRLALGLWLLATAASLFFGRKRYASGLVAAVSLVAVLAGGGLLSRSFARGSRCAVSLLALGDAGAAFAVFRATPTDAGDSYRWLGGRVIGPVAVGFSDDESGDFGSWNHRLGLAAFSVAASSPMTLSGLLTSEAFLPALPSSADSAYPAISSDRDEFAEPPEIETGRPLAYLGAGEGGSWWTKEGGDRWIKAERAPAWLEAETRRIAALKRRRADAAFLAGRIPAASIGLTFQGGPLRGSAVWIMPLPAGAPR